MIDLLRDEVGAPSAENCATIKKKADLAVNVSERLGDLISGTPTMGFLG